MSRWLQCLLVMIVAGGVFTVPSESSAQYYNPYVSEGDYYPYQYDGARYGYGYDLYHNRTLDPYGYGYSPYRTGVYNNYPYARDNYYGSYYTNRGNWTAWW